MVSELWLRSSSEFEEVCAKPNLLYVCLVAALCDDLLHCILLLALLMLPKPHQRKATSPKKLDLIKTFREPISKSFDLLSIQVMLV